MGVAREGELEPSEHPDDRRQRVELADRLTTLGALSAAIGHEINNPLTYVIGNLKVAIEQLSHSSTEERRPELEPLLRDALEGAERISSIVRDMRMLGRHGPGRVEPLDVQSVLELAIRQTENNIRHRAQLTRHIASVPPVDGDAPRLCQVFVNLLLNAAQSIRHGAARRNEIAVGVRTEGDQVFVEVADTGSGIPEEALPHIFDPFFTTKNVGEGTGLGLSISAGIVESFGGRIEVASTSERGTTVRVSLPVSRRMARSAPAQPVLDALPELVNGARRRILVVDDDPKILTAVRRVLSREFDVEALSDAREALLRLERGVRFDLVICDLMMPDMTGVDLHAELEKRSNPHAGRMIFMTGGTFTQEATEFLEAGRIHISKPFDIREFRAVVRSAVADEPDGAPTHRASTGPEEPAADTELCLRFPKQWDQIDAVRESCGYFARASYKDIAVGQRVELVVHELVENAVRATGDEHSEDRVFVDVQGHPEAFEIWVSNPSSHDHVESVRALLMDLRTADPRDAYLSAIRDSEATDNDARLRLARVIYEAQVRLDAQFDDGRMSLVARGAT